MKKRTFALAAILTSSTPSASVIFAETSTFLMLIISFSKASSSKSILIDFVVDVVIDYHLIVVIVVVLPFPFD